MYKEEIERIKDYLLRTSPLDQNYKLLLAELGKLYELEDLEYWRTTHTKEPYKPTPENIIDPADVVKAKSEEPKEPVYTEVVPADLPPATLPEEPAKKAEPTKEEVRALLASKAKEGIVIENILAKYVPEGKPHKFSSIKSSDYAAIMEDLNHAV